MNNESNKPLNPNISNSDINNTDVSNTAPHNTIDKKIEDHTSEHKLPAPDEISNRDVTNKGINADSKANHLAGATINKGSGYLELLEERPVVNKERLDVGKVTVTKHARTRTIEVPIELVEEYITVTTAYEDSESQDILAGNFDDKDILRHVEPSLDSKAVVTINGKQVEIGDAPVEIVLSRQVATITKDTYAIQEIDISKTKHTHTDTIQVELKHEELDVNEEGFLAHDNQQAPKK
ncbi:YsnF/AvaK domain-containing protein [Psychrobacter sp. 1U2]|uniref:YsnF/AvaK domain-containing protein n=1 Tax=Psychrobacter sp. 1U2 TaxID=3453577 RepID=UPI003F46CF1D